MLCLIDITRLRTTTSRVRQQCDFFTSSAATAASAPRDVEIDVPNSFGRLARFADGSAVASMGHTSVLATAVCKNHASSSTALLIPLTVDYRQKSAAAGRIPTNHLRREMGPSEKEILMGRMIDRSLRPLFPERFHLDTQIVCSLLAADGRNDPDVLAINASSAALAVSDIPWNGPVGAVRVGCVDLKLVVNPARRDLTRSALNLVIAGTEDGKAVMLEAEANSLDKEVLLDGVQLGLQSCSAIAGQIRQLSLGVPKRLLPILSSLPADVLREAELLCIGHICEVSQGDRVTFRKCKDEVVATLGKSYPGFQSFLFSECFDRICRDQLAQTSLEKWRAPISCDTNLHPTLHGSSLIQKGHNKVLCKVALDSAEAVLRADPISVITGAVKEKNFFVHYEFPPFATNDIGLAAGGKELDSGDIVEKALRTVIPRDFPFAIRLTSEVLESDGSSCTMASVCGGSLALLDAGVPISAPVAGVAVRLLVVTRPEEGPETLLDVSGLENCLGEANVNLAGTKSGITAFQAKINIPGVNFTAICDAVEQGHRGICDTLLVMDQCLKELRFDKSNLPVSEVLEVPLIKRSKFFGEVNLRKLTRETGVHVTPREDGMWSVFAPNMETMLQFRDFVLSLLEDVEEARLPQHEIGDVVTVRVTEVKDDGVAVEMHGMGSAFIHVSQLSIANETIDHKVGDAVQVKYFGRDPKTGAIRLSRKALSMRSSAVSSSNQPTTQRDAISSKLDESLPPPDNYSRPRELKNRNSTGSSLRSRFYIENIRDDAVADIPTDTDEFSSSSTEQTYYDLDALLNKVMTARQDLDDALERLRVAGDELKRVKAKYVFLEETSWTNRILAEGFRISTYEKYVRLLAKRKAVEESVRHARQCHEELQREFGDAKREFLSKHAKPATTPTARKKALARSELCPGVVEKVTPAGLSVLLKIGDSPKVVFVHRSLKKSGLSPLLSGSKVTLQYLGRDVVSGKDVFIVVDDVASSSVESVSRKSISEETVARLKEKDHWSYPR